MNDIPEAEARALLGRATYCELDGDWSPEKVQVGTFSISSGLTDGEGVGTRMQVELRFRRGHKTGLVTYVFSVFKRTSHGTDRIYQLDVTHSKRPIRNLHDKSHEHMGALRTAGHDSWSNWKFQDVLEYFCNQTNITMTSGPVHPEHFELRS